MSCLMRSVSSPTRGAGAEAVAMVLTDGPYDAQGDGSVVERDLTDRRAGVMRT
jgi:hypothetical protein